MSVYRSEKPNSSLLVEDLPEMSGIQEDASRGEQDERHVEQISDGREETSNEADMDEAPSDGESGLESETEETRDGRKGRKDEKRSNIAPEIRASSKDDGDEDVEEEEMDVMDKGTEDAEEHVGLNGTVGDERVSRTPGRKVRGTPRRGMGSIKRRKPKVSNPTVIICIDMAKFLSSQNTEGMADW